MMHGAEHAVPHSTARASFFSTRLAELWTEKIEELPVLRKLRLFDFLVHALELEFNGWMAHDWIRRLDIIPLLECVGLSASFSPQLVGAMPADEDKIVRVQPAKPPLGDDLTAVRAEVIRETPGRGRT